MRRNIRKAAFPRLRALREERLGWDVTDITAKLPGGKPSIASIYRLEQGHSIRLASARRVFDVINAALDNTLNVADELRIEE
jgi:hypothetical protein